MGPYIFDHKWYLSPQSSGFYYFIKDNTQIVVEAVLDQILGGLAIESVGVEDGAAYVEHSLPTTEQWRGGMWVGPFTPNDFQE